MVFYPRTVCFHHIASSIYINPRKPYLIVIGIEINCITQHYEEICEIYTAVIISDISFNKRPSVILETQFYPF